MGIMNSGVCLTEEELDKIVERKMEMVIKKYDREIAALEEKIRAQDVKIHNLEKKYSAKKLDSEKETEKEKESFQRFASNRDYDTNIQRKIQATSDHDSLIRAAQGNIIRT